ncbi:Uncharacterised protein [Candidatus Burarchaeum australiense]|nr:Uncharacterised protein [Candidatus Burarchaeum australiense]
MARMEKMSGEKCECECHEGKDCDCRCHRRGGGGIFFGVLIFLLGVVWLGNDMYWWNVNLPFIPLVVILVGLWMMSRKMRYMGAGQ